MFPLDLSFLYVYKPVTMPHRVVHRSCVREENYNIEKSTIYIEKDEGIVRGTSGTSVAK